MAWPNPAYTRWLCASTRPKVEDGITIDVHRMVKGRPPGTFYSGSWAWKDSDGDRVAWISYSVKIHSEGFGGLTLKFRVNDEPVEQHINVVSQSCRFGGQRWFAICPYKNVRVAKLHTCGGKLFLSRQAYGGAYRSQSECPIDRTTRRRDKLLRKLDTWDVDLLPKPKWMRRKTYERLVDEIDYLDNLWSAHMMRRFGDLSKIFSRS